MYVCFELLIGGYLQALVQDCIKALSEHFPRSPRVDVLTGIRMEASEPPEVALQYYDSLLEEDSAHGVRSINVPSKGKKLTVLRRVFGSDG